MSDDEINDLAIARKARDLSAEAEQLRADKAALMEQLDSYRKSQPGLTIIGREEKQHGLQCLHLAPGIRHPVVVLDDTDRTVRCRRCQRKLDAFDVLMEYASGERNLLYTNDALLREHRNLTEQIEGMKRDLAEGKMRNRVACPKCGLMVAPAPCVAGGLTAHGCYKRRADEGKVPRRPEERWRMVTEDGRGTRWCDHISALRAAEEHGGTVEEYTLPIGDTAERAAARRQARDELDALIEAGRAARRARKQSKPGKDRP